MRTALALLLVGLLSACAVQVAQPAVSPVVPPSGAGTSIMLPQVRQMFEDRAVFLQTPVAAPTTPISLADQLYRFAGGPSGMVAPWQNVWEVYMSPVAAFDSQMRNLPQPVTVVAAPGPNKVPSKCAPLVGQDLTRPYVCSNVQKDAEQTTLQYIVVVPAAFDALLKRIEAQSGTESAWRVAAIGAAVIYADYLRQTYKPFIGWPDSDTADFCFAGISNRVVFTKAKLLDKDLAAAVTALDTVLGGDPATRGQRMVAFMDGFNSGQLAHCAGY